MKNLMSVLATSLLCLSMVACGDDNKTTTQNPSPDSYYDEAECERLDIYGTGIRGNRACPYKGSYDQDSGHYQQASISFESELNFRLGLGYRLDFGWDNDWQNLCPGPGEIPVFVSGRFNHCVNSNPTYANPHDGSNTSACAGSPTNPQLTNCTPGGITPTGDGNVRYTH